LEVLKEVVAIRERVATANPTNATWQHHLALAYILLGNSLFERSDPERALVPWRKSLAIMERLTAIYPQQIDWQIDLGAVLNRVGDTVRHAGQFQEALKIFQRQLQITEKVLATDPQNSLARANLGVDKERMGWIFFALGRLEDALPYLDEAVQIKTALNLDRNPKDQASARWERAVARLYTGRIEDAAEDLETAANLNPSEMYHALWLHIVRSRLGIHDGRELAARAKNFDFGNGLVLSSPSISDNWMKAQCERRPKPPKNRVSATKTFAVLTTMWASIG
jgi:tetratricopeptide (TPR) repeat protein